MKTMEPNIEQGVFKISSLAIVLLKGAENAVSVETLARALAFG